MYQIESLCLGFLANHEIKDIGTLRLAAAGLAIRLIASGSFRLEMAGHFVPEADRRQEPRQSMVRTSVARCSNVLEADGPNPTRRSKRCFRSGNPVLRCWNEGRIGLLLRR